MKYLILIALCAFTQLSAQAQQTVEVYTYNQLPPYAYHNKQGELTGVYIDIVQTAVSRMPDYSLSFKVVPWSRAKKEAQLGHAFAILPPYFHAHDWFSVSTPKRPYIWPYSLPLYTQQDVVICTGQALQQPRIHYPNDFKGLRFAMWRGDGRAGEAFQKMLTQHEISVVYVDSIKEAAQSLVYSRADCTVTSKLPFNWSLSQIKQTPNYKKYTQLRQPVELKQALVISNNPGHLGYTDINDEINFPFKKDFVIKFDIEIYKMQRSGELQGIVNKYLKPATQSASNANGSF